ncbi:glycosyl transferase [Asaia sp. SF2.1]|nr:glycosyl transferase [Asaia sp. SF2.1]
MFRLGRDIIGPVVAQYIQNLHQSLLYFEGAQNAKIFFMARAGLRIRQALEVYLSRVGREVPSGWDYLWASRMMIAKGLWTRTPLESCALFDDAYAYTDIDIARRCIVGEHTGNPRNIDLEQWHWTSDRLDLGGMILRNAPQTAPIRAHLEEQSNLFLSRVRASLGKHDTAVLVDSGWAGTSQKMLQAGLPDIDWWGLYFGLIPDEDGGKIAQAEGLVFEANRVDWNRPETCIISHRHLIEDLFETRAPSIESYYRDDLGTILAVGEKENLASLNNNGADHIYSGVLYHLARAPVDLLTLRINAEHAMKRLQQFLLVPTKSEAEVLLKQRRSADLGRSFSVPVLISPDGPEKSEERISRALWKNGQIALEYPADMAAPVQRSSAGLRYPSTHKRPCPDVLNATLPTVAVITRTMDRSLFLRRALLSVSSQSFRDYVHVVVCDGGDAELIKKTIVEANIDHSKIIFVESPINIGMEAASNLAISKSTSEFIVIHDDDDSWHPDFLKKTIDYLRSAEGRKYGGVVTQALHVSESVHPDGIQTHSTKLYRDDFFAPNLEEIRRCNTFAPISFVFRRTCYDEVGGYNEKYPVLGDWDFNINFLYKYDIGYIRETLSNYHHRDVREQNVFGNSIISGRDKHIEYNPILLNDLARKHRVP